MNLNTLYSSINVEARPFIKDDVELPTSKSYANRLLIMAALDPRPIKIHDIPNSTDVLHLIECLAMVGVQIDRTGVDVVVRNSFPDCEIDGDELTLRTGDGGTTNRFLACMLCLGKRRYVLSPSENMHSRPIQEFINVAKELGVDVKSESGRWLSFQGPLSVQTNEVYVDCSQTTQIASGFAIVLSSIGVKVRPKSLSSSKSYWDLTLRLIKNGEFGTGWSVPVDFSGASYPIALAAVTGMAGFSQIQSLDPYQGDSQLINILGEMGAKCVFTTDGLKVYKTERLDAFDVDCTRFPDLAPTLAYLACFASGKSLLRRTDILRHKETDRLIEILKLLDLYAVKYRLNDEGLEITGGVKRTQWVCYNSPPDHRLIMMAYALMRSVCGGTINNTFYVKKSFPRFFDIMT